MGLPAPFPCCLWLSGGPQKPLQGRGEGEQRKERRATTATYMVPCLLDLSEKEWAGKIILGVNHLLPHQQDCNPKTRAEGQTTWEMGPANGKRTETAHCHLTGGFRKHVLLRGCAAPNTQPDSRGGWGGWGSAGPAAWAAARASLDLPPGEEGPAHARHGAPQGSMHPCHGMRPQTRCQLSPPKSQTQSQARTSR